MSGSGGKGVLRNSPNFCNIQVLGSRVPQLSPLLQPPEGESGCEATNSRDNWNHYVKMDLKLLVLANLTFSEYLRRLNFLLWLLCPAKTKQVQESNLFCDSTPSKCGKFKNLKFSENVNFVQTNSVDYILVVNIMFLFLLSNF